MKWWIINLALLLCIVPAVAQVVPAVGTDTTVTASVAAAGVDGLVAIVDHVGEKADSLGATPVTTVNDNPFYMRNTQRLHRDWARLAPSLLTGQYAGSIGAWSVGVGWHYGRHDHWETELLLGYVPHSHGAKHHLTMTAKERYIPWHVSLTPHRRWVLEPLTAGFFANVIFGEGYWRHEPSKYTKGYYGFNTKVRYNLCIGQRLRYNIPHRHRMFYKSVTVYYELSSSDLKIVSSVPNRAVHAGDILSLGFGVRLEMF